MYVDKDMYVHRYTYVDIYIYAILRLHMHIHRHTYIHICIYTHTDMFFTQICCVEDLYVRIYIGICTYVYTCAQPTWCTWWFMGGHAKGKKWPNQSYCCTCPTPRPDL